MRLSLHLDRVTVYIIVRLSSSSLLSVSYRSTTSDKCFRTLENVTTLSVTRVTRNASSDNALTPKFYSIKMANAINNVTRITCDIQKAA